jgi:hypothetical protein
MVSNLSALELSCMDRLSREQLIVAIRARAADLPADLLEGLEGQPTDGLRLLLLAGRLVQVLRHMRTPR